MEGFSTCKTSGLLDLCYTQFINHGILSYYFFLGTGINVLIENILSLNALEIASSSCHIVCLY